MSFGIVDQSDRHMISNLALSMPQIPLDYWDFPINCYSFLTSAKGATFRIENDVCYRVRGDLATIMYWTCSNQDLIRTIKHLAARYKIRSMNWIHRDLSGVPVVKDLNEYWSDNLNPDDYLKSVSKSIRKAIRQAERRIVVEINPSKDETMSVYEQWVSWAKGRIFNFSSSYPRRFLQLHYLLESCKTYLFGFRDSRDNKLLMVAGGEICCGRAVNTVCKGVPLESYVDQLPRYADYFVVKYLWESGIKGRLFNGTTLDKIKQRLPYQWAKSYKLDISSIIKHGG